VLSWLANIEILVSLLGQANALADLERRAAKLVGEMTDGEAYFVL
jgi:hypothetical protein